MASIYVSTKKHLANFYRALPLKTRCCEEHPILTKFIGAEKPPNLPPAACALCQYKQTNPLLLQLLQASRSMGSLKNLLPVQDDS
jgi:hypothetical protein